MSNAIESQIDGAFYGWSGDTLFKLSNGQFWLQARYAYRYHYAYRPRVRITLSNGCYFMKVEGMVDSLQVRRLSGDIVESRIAGEFTGWNGETTFQLENGQIWQQANYSYTYHYAFRPEVVIYNFGSGYKLKVDGLNEKIEVRRIR